MNELKLIDFVGEAWWFILLVLSAGWVCELYSRRKFRNRRKNTILKQRSNLNTVTNETISEMQLAQNSLGPTRRSFWVVQDRLAGGAYPGKKGRHDDPDNPKAVQDLLAAGIDVFINLTQDFPGGTDEHLNHYDLGAEGKAVIERYPIIDVSIPRFDTMSEIIDSINDHLSEGKNVYVHCWGGSGRTGTVLGCWLIDQKLANGETVLNTLSELRRGDLDGGHKDIPQTIEQAEFIFDWELLYPK